VRFQPVHLPPDRALGDGASQTFLRHLNLCPRSAFLYQRYRGQAQTVEMQRGRLGHRAVELATRAVIENGEVAIPPELAKVMVDEAIASPQYACPIEHHDYVREAVYRWAAETAIDPALTVSVEGLFEMDVAGWRVRCRIDFAELSADGSTCVIKDYKFGPGAPPFDEVARKRPDGTLAAKSMQLILYALVLAYGYPVREEACDCERAGAVVYTDGGEPWRCASCGGKGRIETREPFPVASRAQLFETEFVFPAIEDAGGKMVRRPLSLTRLELEAYRPSLDALLRTLDYRVESGDWPAVVSDEACAICPAASECPIPRELRDHRGAVNTPEEAAQAFEVRARVTAEQRAIQRELRSFVERNGPVVYGNGMVAELVYSESESVSDKEGLFGAVEMAVKYGEPFERSRYVKTKGATRLKERPLTADELLEAEMVKAEMDAATGIATEGSNG
jgi:hypothetical protein